MQLVRADEIFRFLYNVAVLVSRFQFRTDRCVNDIHQYLMHSSFAQSSLLAEMILCSPSDKIFDQCLGDAGIYGIHRHVVAVVSSPAQSRF